MTQRSNPQVFIPKCMKAARQAGYGTCEVTLSPTGEIRIIVSNDDPKGPDRDVQEELTRWENGKT